MYMLALPWSSTSNSYLNKASRSDLTTVGVVLNGDGSMTGVEATTRSCAIRALEIPDSSSSFCLISLSSCVGGLSEEAR